LDFKESQVGKEKQDAREFKDQEAQKEIMGQMEM
jgi:hypothetical protein